MLSDTACTISTPNHSYMVVTSLRTILMSTPIASYSKESRSRYKCQMPMTSCYKLIYRQCKRNASWTGPAQCSRDVSHRRYVLVAVCHTGNTGKHKSRHLHVHRLIVYYTDRRPGFSWVGVDIGHRRTERLELAHVVVVQTVVNVQIGHAAHLPHNLHIVNPGLLRFINTIRLETSSFIYVKYCTVRLV